MARQDHLPDGRKEQQTNERIERTDESDPKPQ
jgi:hypothetical protein